MYDILKKMHPYFIFRIQSKKLWICEKDMTFKKSMANKTEEEDLEWLQKNSNKNENKNNDNNINIQDEKIASNQDLNDNTMIH